MADHAAITQVFQKMDSDSILERVDTGFYIDGRNFKIYTGRDGNAGAVRFIDGTVELFWAPPAGVNTGIGAYADETGDTLIAFIHNDQGNHSIIRYYPGDTDAHTITIPQLNLQADKPVVGCAFINQELLIFTDGGDYPKCINLPRADDTDKKSIVRLYFKKPNQVLSQRDFSAKILLDGVIVGVPVTLPSATSQQVWDFTAMVQAFAQNWNNLPALGNYFTARGAATYVELEATSPGMYSVDVESIDFINGVPQPTFTNISEYWNRYNDPFTEQQITLAKITPIIPPYVFSYLDADTPSSQIEQKTWQFAYGYRMKDKERTLVSPISDIVVPSSGSCGAVAPPNTIEIGFVNDKWLNDPSTRGEIETIDIYVREGNDGSWLVAKSMDKPEWIYARSWKFKNNIACPAADQAFVEAAFTSMPERANALEALVDADDNTRIVLGGCTEGHPTPDVPINVRVEFDAGAATAPKGAVVMNIRIINFTDQIPFAFRQSQPIWKLKPDEKIVFGGLGNNVHSANMEDLGQFFGKGSSGFTVYAEGTSFSGMSVQNVFSISGQSPDLVAGTNAYDGTSQYKRDKIRDGINAAPVGDNVYSRLLITGLDAGRTYVFRMADHRCGLYEKGDPEYGTLYDLNAVGLGYQQTSSQPFVFGTTVNPNVRNGTFECTVTIPPAGATIDIGEVLIADASRPGVLSNFYLHKVWLRDNGGNDNTVGDDIRTNGYPAEKQEITYDSIPGFTSMTFPTTWEYMRRMVQEGKVWTDHNGHAFFFSAIPSPYAKWESEGPTMCNDFSASKWEGSLDTSSPLTAATAPLGAGGQLYEYFFPNLNNDAQGRIRTHVTCDFTDQSGAPLQGVLAVFENGGSAVSDSAGRVRIPAYVDMQVGGNSRIVDRLVVASGIACNMTFVQDKLPVNIYTYVLNGTYSEFVDYVIATQSVIVFGTISVRCFSRGGVYPIGYYLKQDDGSRTPVRWLADVAIPHLGQDLHTYDPLLYPIGTYNTGIARLAWAISGDVPIPWAGRWECLQFVVGTDGTKVFQLQWLAGEITYASEWDKALSTPRSVGYSSGTAMEIYINLTDSLTRYQEIYTDSQLGYLWERGDRLRILTNRFGIPLQRVIDVPLRGQRNASGQVGQWIVLQNSSSIPELFGGETIEIYRPSKTSLGTGRQIFYDIPSGIVSINDAYGITPTWSALNGDIRNGDTYMLPTLVPNRSSSIQLWQLKRLTRESKSASDFYPSASWGKGKPWFQDPDSDTQENGTRMRYTDSYKPGTNINGLNFVGGLNFRIVENWLGPIRKMERIGDVIFVVCENGAFSVYVAIEQLQTTPDAVVQTAGGILGTIRPFAHKHGTKHPMSVIRGTTNVLYYDVANGAIVQYNSNALQDVAEQNKMHAYFSEKALTIPSGRDVCAGWDNVNGQFTFTFAAHTYDDGFNVQDIEAESITYFDQANAFVAKLDIATDFWGKTRNFTYSFKDGRLWGHGFPAAVKNNVHGVDLKLSIDIPFIGSELVLKTPQYIWVSRGPANKLAWSAPLVRTDDGQVSMIPKEDFETLRGGISRGNFYADSNTPSYNVTAPTLSNGDPLMGTAFVVRLEYDGDGEPALINATLFYSNVTPT